MKKLIGGLLVMALIPMALMVGCNDNNPNAPGSSTTVGSGPGGPAGPGTPTSTPSTTPSIPMGLWITANFQRSIVNASLLGASPTTVLSATVTLSINHTAESTDSVILTTPNEGPIALPYSQLTSPSGIPAAEYANITPFTYVTNGIYSIAVSTSLGTVTTNLYAPGSITFNSTGASVTALYPGNFDSAQVERFSPSPITITYQSSANVSVGSPFTYPLSAFSSPATFYSGFTAEETVSLPSPAAAGSSFVGSDSLNEYISR